MFLTAFKQEPVAFCIANNREEEAKTLLKRIYLKRDDREDFDKLIDEHVEFLK